MSRCVFKSKYGLILYEYLLSRERQERQSEHKYSISIEDLRRLTDTEKKFKNFKELNMNDEVYGNFEASNNLIKNIQFNNQEIEEDGEKYILKIDPKGLDVREAYITGTFDFSSCNTDLPFIFLN